MFEVLVRLRTIVLSGLFLDNGSNRTLSAKLSVMLVLLRRPIT